MYVCVVLRFVGPGDDLRSCGFIQMMEQRLENAFAEAEAVVMNSHSGLTVQVGGPKLEITFILPFIYFIWGNCVFFRGGGGGGDF